MGHASYLPGSGKTLGLRWGVYDCVSTTAPSEMKISPSTNQPGGADLGRLPPTVPYKRNVSSMPSDLQSQMPTEKGTTVSLRLNYHATQSHQDVRGKWVVSRIEFLGVGSCAG